MGVSVDAIERNVGSEVLIGVVGKVPFSDTIKRLSPSRGFVQFESGLWMACNAIDIMESLVPIND